jgi:hypothetical protein
MPHFAKQAYTGIILNKRGKLFCIAAKLQHFPQNNKLFVRV